MFVKEPLEFPELYDETLPSGSRHYVTPEGKKYPSVTTVLGTMDDKTHLQEWRERIGYEKADKISKQALVRGKAIHKCLEDYVDGNFKRDEHPPIILDLFLKGQSALDAHITKVYNQEFCVYSDRLGTAGRCDLLADWDGIPSIVDYKGSDNPKRLEWISGYIRQECTYALCIGETKKLVVPQLVTVIVCESAPEPQIFIQKTSDWMKETISIFKSFHQKYPNYIQ